jgi:hypothetical protein
MAAAPAPGTYVEIRRGSYVIVGRIVWVKGHRFGVRTQDPMLIDAIINTPDVSGALLPTAPQKPVLVDRRASPRTLQNQHDQSRIAARAAEFATLVLLAASAALVVSQTVNDAVAHPFSVASAVLN